MAEIDDRYEYIIGRNQKRFITRACDTEGYEPYFYR